MPKIAELADHVLELVAEELDVPKIRFCLNPVRLKLSMHGTWPQNCFMPAISIPRG